MSTNHSYILRSVKAIEFYNKNPSLDFDNVNELFVELIQNITNNIKESISVNEVKALLNTINKKVDGLEQNMGAHQKFMQMTYERLNEQKESYVQQVKELIQNKDNGGDILTLIREMNTNMIDKTTYSILQQFPKLSDDMKGVQKEIIENSQQHFQRVVAEEREKGGYDPDQLEKTIQGQYQHMSDKMMQTLHNVFNQDSVFYQNNMELRHFLEKQKNSTKKGKESETRLEVCITYAYPQAVVVDKSGESKACDYLLKRQDKCDILFENKDYQTNVPNEEIKKFIRDIEYQGKHGIMISQHSGIQNKDNFQIDIHANHIMVYVHHGNYDDTKIKIAVNIIDHLDCILQKQDCDQSTLQFSMEQLSEINKEYLHFIGQKKQLIEMYKKQHKDHLRQLEDFEMPQLTALLNSTFTNVEQLSFKCQYCNVYNAKNKRALVTHQNKCKKKIMLLNNQTDISSSSASASVTDENEV